MKVWKFYAEAFEKKYPFYIDESVPFVGNYKAAEREAQRRSENWERANNDFICRIICEERAK